MAVRNLEAERVRSNCTEVELSRALQALDLASIPEHLRKRAIIERLALVMLSTTTDPRERAKPAYQQVAALALNPR